MTTNTTHAQHTAAPTTENIRIVFVSYAACRHFILQNGFTPAEIIAQTRGSITVRNQTVDFRGNMDVYEVQEA